jgi:hypothetical protein
MTAPRWAADKLGRVLGADPGHAHAWHLSDVRWLMWMLAPVLPLPARPAPARRRPHPDEWLVGAVERVVETVFITAGRLLLVVLRAVLLFGPFVLAGWALTATR